MGKKYIHYGTSRFMPELFESVRNLPFRNKPAGGLWASECGKKSWQKWCKENWPEVLERYKEHFEFELGEETRIFRMDSLEKFSEFIGRYADPSGLGMCNYDFEAMSLDYDVLEFCISECADLYTCMYGWDFDSIFILNPEVIVIRKRREK